MTAETVSPLSLSLTEAQVKDLLAVHYSLDARHATPMHSELSSVYRVELADGSVVAFKALHMSAHTHALAQWQASAMEHVHERGLPVGEIRRNLRGELISITSASTSTGASTGAGAGTGTATGASTATATATATATEAGTVLVQVNEWLTGTALADVPVSSKLMRAVGGTAAQVALALSDWPDVTIAHGHPWELLRTLDTIESALTAIDEAATVALLGEAAARFDEIAAPRLAMLPHAVLHHDLHDSNLLIDESGQRVSGVLDFGDLVWGPRIAELAVTAGYACRGAADPVAAYLDVAAGWGSVLPLRPEEVEVLFAASIGRLAVNLGVWSARRQSDRGDYAHLRSRTTAHALTALLDADPARTTEMLLSRLCANREAR